MVLRMRSYTLDCVAWEFDWLNCMEIVAKRVMEVHSRWYGEHVQNPGFAAEWWNNICFWSFWILHGFGDELELDWLFSKDTGCMLRICKWIWTFLVRLRFPGCVWWHFCHWFHSFFNNKWDRFFWKTLRFAFFGSCMSLQEFCGQNGCFWNLSELCDEFEVEKVNSTHVQLKWNGREFIFVFPLPLPRRQSQKERDATQCMLHDKQTRCFASFSCVEKNWVLVQWQPLFWGSVLVQTLDVVRPTPTTRPRATRVVVAIRSCWIFAQKRQAGQTNWWGGQTNQQTENERNQPHTGKGSADLTNPGTRRHKQRIETETKKAIKSKPPNRWNSSQRIVHTKRPRAP